MTGAHHDHLGIFENMSANLWLFGVPLTLLKR
jgi:hypothetical protein